MGEVAVVWMLMWVGLAWMGREGGEKERGVPFPVLGQHMLIPHAELLP